MIIALEGQSSVGKTTLFNYLTNNDTVAGVSELTSIVPGALKFPTTELEAIANEALIIRIEEIRLEMSTKLDKLPHVRFVFMDRSIISTLVIAACNSRIYGWQNLQLLIDALISSSVSFLPDIILHLNVDRGEIRNRFVSRSDRLSKSWTNDDFGILQEAVYNKIYDFLSNSGLCQVFMIDCNLPQHDVALYISNLLPNLKYSTSQAQQNNFYEWFSSHDNIF